MQKFETKLNEQFSETGDRIKGVFEDAQTQFTARMEASQDAALKVAEGSVDSIIRWMPERPEGAPGLRLDPTGAVTAVYELGSKVAKANYEFTNKLIGVFQPLWAGAESEENKPAKAAQ